MFRPHTVIFRPVVYNTRKKELWTLRGKKDPEEASKGLLIREWKMGRRPRTHFVEEPTKSVLCIL